MPDTKTDCPAYDGCKAPICPLDSSFAKAVWYVDEPFCVARKFRRAKWRIVQRKIAKVHLRRPVIGFFTVSALENIRRVAGGICGY